MWNLEKKMVKMILFVSRNRDIDTKNKCIDTKEEAGCGMNWEIRIDIYTLLCIKQITNENYCITEGTLFSALQRPKQERKKKKRGDICIQMADSLCYTVETDITM